MYEIKLKVLEPGQSVPYPTYRKQFETKEEAITEKKYYQLRYKKGEKRRRHEYAELSYKYPAKYPHERKYIKSQVEIKVRKLPKRKVPYYMKRFM